MPQNGHEVAACQPEEKNEKDPVCPDHLCFLGPSQRRTEGDAQGRCGDIIPENAQQSDEQGSQKKKQPEGKGDLFGRQESKTDERRIDVDFKFVESGEQPLFGEIGSGEDQRRDLRHIRVIEMEAV